MIISIDAWPVLYIIYTRCFVHIINIIQFIILCMWLICLHSWCLVYTCTSSYYDLSSRRYVDCQNIDIILKENQHLIGSHKLKFV